MKISRFLNLIPYYKNKAKKEENKVRVHNLIDDIDDQFCEIKSKLAMGSIDEDQAVEDIVLLMKHFLDNSNNQGI